MQNAFIGTHFKKVGWIYIPVTLPGWIVIIIYFSVSILTFLAIYQNYHSLRSTLIRFFPYYISFSVLYFWIASNTSSGSSEQNKTKDDG
jgi:hypothetical protein